MNGVPDVSLVTITGYALVDAVDPCSLAAMVIMLVAVIAQGPFINKPNRKAVLYTGLSFTAAVFITYFALGLVLVQLFRLVADSISYLYQVIYSGLGIAAIVLGIFNVKDAVWSKHCGREGILFELPSVLRPRVERIAGDVTGAGVAFAFGVMVTALLLPFTMGPYVITGGILSASGGVVASVPWLALYNAVFVIPMLAVTLIIYAEYGRIKKVSGLMGKAKHLHVLTGAILISLGSLMLLGLV